MAKDKKSGKKQPMTWKDWIFWYFSIFGSIFILASLAPPLPWRYAKASSSFGQRFLVPRSMGLFMLGNQYGQGMAWFKLRSEVCRKMDENTRPNPLAVGMSLASMTMAESSDGAISAGGAIAGCAAWQACKEHVTARCSAYSAVAIVGIIAFIFLLLGAVSAVMGTIFMVKEAKVKKKKFEEAQWNTALAGIFGFVLPFIGTVVWMVTTESTFKGLQASGHYPYPGNYIGYWVALVGNVLLFFAMVCGIRRQDYYQVEEEEEEEVYDPGVGVDAAQPFMQQGQVPPGMGPPGMPMPGMPMPGMGPPGMGGPPGSTPMPGMPMPGMPSMMPGGMPGQAAPPPPMYAQ